jgi:uncharacterized alkaline shock family protein YloU
MATELNLDGLDIAPGVVETIVQLAASQVEGVECVDSPGIGKISKPNKPIEIALADDGTFSVTVHVTARYGRPLRQLAAAVRDAVSDALLSQTGRAASLVDVFVDQIVFPEQ